MSGTVTIAEGGSWSGSIVAANVIVAGRVSGDILSSGQVEIGRTAHIEGVVTGEKIAVAEGAVVDGEMKTRSQDEPLSFSEKRNA